MITRHLRSLGVSCLLAASALPFHAQAQTFFTGTVDGVSLGDAGQAYQYAIFSLGGLVTLSASTDTVIGTIGSNASSGTAVSNSGGVIDGNVWLQSGASFSGTNPASGFSVIKGTNGSILTTGASNAMTASTNASNLTATSGLSSITSINDVSTTQTITYTATGAGANNTDVLKLSLFSLASSTLTLSGSSSDHFIIDVSGTYTVSSSTVALSGGLTAADVLFNVTGGPVNIKGTNSVVNGIILAPTETVALSGGASGAPTTVNGEVIAQAVTLSGTSKINNPTFSP